MSGRADYTEQEWHTLLQGPPSAGMIVMLADRGGTFRETFAMGKAYAEARSQHGASQLLDEVVAAKPAVDRSHHGSVEELTRHALACIHEAIAVVERKAAPEEIEQYRGFVLGVAEKVARAHTEDGVEVGPGEQRALAMISEALTGDGDAAPAPPQD